MRQKRLDDLIKELVGVQQRIRKEVGGVLEFHITFRPETPDERAARLGKKGRK